MNERTNKRREEKKNQYQITIFNRWILIYSRRNNNKKKMRIVSFDESHVSD